VTTFAQLTGRITALSWLERLATLVMLVFGWKPAAVTRGRVAHKVGFTKKVFLSTDSRL